MTERVPLSVVILARNEASNIVRCVSAVIWCDDVVVVDDSSTDETASIAANAGARVVQHRFESFASQRNWAMQHAELKHNWVLHLDADEVVTPALQQVLTKIVSAVDPGVVAFRMCRKTMFRDSWLRFSDGFPVWIMRLTDRRVARFVDQGHGEVAVPGVDGEVGTIEEPFLHFAFSKGLADWIDRHNRYSTREAELEMKSAKRVSVRELFSKDRARRRNGLRAFSRRLPIRPWLRFVYQYFAKLGFLDGRAGWTFSCLMAEYERWIVLKRDELIQWSEPSNDRRVDDHA